MRHWVLLSVVGLVFLPALASGDTLRLANSGKVAGTITELKLKIGPLEKAFSRDGIRSITFDKTSCQVIGSDGTKYIGSLDSVAIRSGAGELNFDGNSVRGVELETEAGKPVEEPPAAPPAELPPTVVHENRMPEAPPPPLSPEQKRRFQGLLKKASELRDGALAQISQAAGAEYAVIKKEYLDKWKTACADMEARRKEYAKYADKMTGPADNQREVGTRGLGIGIAQSRTVIPLTGPGADAYKEYMAALERRDKLASEIRARQAAVDERAALRRDRVRSYYFAIYRQLTAGKEVPVDAMGKIFEKALK